MLGSAALSVCITALVVLFILEEQPRCCHRELSSLSCWHWPSAAELYKVRVVAIQILVLRVVVSSFVLAKIAPAINIVSYILSLLVVTAGALYNTLM